MQRGLDHRRAVHGQVQLHAGRQHCLQRRQLGLDRVHSLDDIGPGLAVDHQQHRRIVIEKPAVVTVFHAVLDLGYMAQAQRRTVLVTDDQRLVVLGFFQLVVGLDLPVALAIGHRALGPAHVGIGDGAAHVIQRHAVLVEQLRFQFDAHGGQRTAANLHFTHTRHLGQALREDGRGQIIELALGQHLGGQGQHHDRRLRGVDLLVGGHAFHAAGQQVARSVDCRLHLPRRAVDVAILIKLQNHPGRTLARITAHGIDPGNRTEGPLQRRGHSRCHHLGAGPGQTGRHHDHREIHLRQRRHRQQAKAHPAQQHDCQAQQHGGYRALDKRAGQVHTDACSAWAALPRQRRPKRSKYR